MDVAHLLLGHDHRLLHGATVQRVDLLADVSLGVAQAYRVDLIRQDLNVGVAAALDGLPGVGRHHDHQIGVAAAELLAGVLLIRRHGFQPQELTHLLGHDGQRRLLLATGHDEDGPRPGRAHVFGDAKQEQDQERPQHQHH